MALSYDSLSAVTKDKFIPVMIDNIFDSNILTHKMLRESEPIATGNKVLQPIEYAKSGAKGFYNGYDVLDTTPQEVFTDASYDWVQCHASITYSGREEALNSGSERVIDLISAKVKNAEKSLKDLFGSQLYSDNSGSAVSTPADATTNGFVGLQHICAVDRTLGGINSTTYTWWDAQAGTFGSNVFNTVSASSGANSIGRELRDMYGKCTVDQDAPNLIVTTQIIFDAYEESLTAQKRYGASSTDLADAGFQALKYRGADVVVDDHCPAGHMYFINTKYLKFRHNAQRNFAFQGFKKPVNQDASVAQILWLGALTCSNPRMLGVVTGGPTAY
ncbi:MAG: putative major head protein [Prokaryotic dsDNA virus sp.]|nr:MAG: putative major head protein [Prokaryotic dsDNA virus sp.]|tara:strand:- start:5855 stop:6850 length:996 start_codon:yes stop_codon:yes gene_type:complete